MTDHGTCTVPWLEPLTAALVREQPVVLVVVATTQGSAPRETGAAMIVSAAQCVGSIGGGHLEYEATRIARDALATQAPCSTWIVRFPLAARLGQCCGGVATLAFSKVDGHARGWLEAAAACARTGAPFALVTGIAAATESGSRLLVTLDDARGTLGNGTLDSAAIALARTRLAGAARGAALVRFAHDEEATLLVQVERPDPFPVILFGNGHVGRALVEVLGVVPAQVRWVDSRGEDFPRRIPDNVEVVVSDAPEDELRAAPSGAFVVVTTHSHALDFTLIEAALARDDWRYVGLIGSKSKRAQFERRLAARGHAADALARVRHRRGAARCPGSGRPLAGIAHGVTVRRRPPAVN
jgi:xanthine dehydrogenase accessory factor